MESGYDDSRLRRLFEDLEPKRRLQAMRGAFRKTAKEVRNRAVANLRDSVNSSKDLEKGIRTVVFRRTAGFRVTVGTKAAGRNGRGEAGYHLNRQGLKKPVLIWAEGGTKERRTKGNGGRRATRLRASHFTGRMPRFAFMEKTLTETRDKVTDELRVMVTHEIERVARKYGCE